LELSTASYPELAGRAGDSQARSQQGWLGESWRLADQGDSQSRENLVVVTRMLCVKRQALSRKPIRLKVDDGARGPPLDRKIDAWIFMSAAGYWANEPRGCMRRWVEFQFSGLDFSTAHGPGDEEHTP
jgi:hypothetical protein